MVSRPEQPVASIRTAVIIYNSVATECGGFPVEGRSRAGRGLAIGRTKAETKTEDGET